MSSRFKVKVPVGKISRNMERDHIDVLQNIEFALVTAHRQNPAVDDAAVREALVATLNGREPADSAGPAAQVAWLILKGFRDQRPDVGDDLWHDGLRVVLHSVKNHSTLQPGETSYLDFTAPFLP